MTLNKNFDNDDRIIKIKYINGKWLYAFSNDWKHILVVYNNNFLKDYSNIKVYSHILEKEFVKRTAELNERK